MFVNWPFHVAALLPYGMVTGSQTKDPEKSESGGRCRPFMVSL